MSDRTVRRVGEYLWWEGLLGKVCLVRCRPIYIINLAWSSCLQMHGENQNGNLELPGCVCNSPESGNLNIDCFQMRLQTASSRLAITQATRGRNDHSTRNVSIPPLLGLGHWGTVPPLFRMKRWRICCHLLSTKAVGKVRGPVELSPLPLLRFEPLVFMKKCCFMHKMCQIPHPDRRLRPLSPLLDLFSSLPRPGR